jgi:hypothetical protein
MSATKVQVFENRIVSLMRMGRRPAKKDVKNEG